MAPNALTKFLLVAVLFVLTYGHPFQPCLPCMSKLRRDGIIPDYAESVGSTRIRIVYPGNNVVRCGNRLPMNQLSGQPTITFTAAKPGSYYTILMFDPDQAQPYTNYVYYLVVNVPGSDLCQGKVNNGYEVFDYIQPNVGIPLIGDNDKFVYFAYEQRNGKIKKKDLSINIFLHRFPFDPKDFAEKHDLGCPSAAQYHRIRGATSDPASFIPNGNPDSLTNVENSPNSDGLITV